MDTSPTTPLDKKSAAFTSTLEKWLIQSNKRHWFYMNEAEFRGLAYEIGIDPSRLSGKNAQELRMLIVDFIID